MLEPNYISYYMSTSALADKVQKIFLSQRINPMFKIVFDEDDKDVGIEFLDLPEHELRVLRNYFDVGDLEDYYNNMDSIVCKIIGISDIAAISAVPASKHYNDNGFDEVEIFVQLSVYLDQKGLVLVAKTPNTDPGQPTEDRSVAE